MHEKLTMALKENFPEQHCCEMSLNLNFFIKLLNEISQMVNYRPEE